MMVTTVVNAALNLFKGSDTGDGDATWHPLVSSNLASYRYHSRAQTLYIRFTSGREYTFEGVPQDVVDGLSSAASPGKYFNSAIKDQFKTAWKKK